MSDYSCDKSKKLSDDNNITFEEAHKTIREVDASKFSIFNNKAQYRLKDVYDCFCDYTGYDEEYDTNITATRFSERIKNHLKHYALQEYLSAIQPQKRKNFEKDTYQFTKNTTDLLSISLGCSIPPKSKGNNKYNTNIINPFGSTSNSNAKNKDLPSLSAYINHIQDYISKNNIPHINTGEMDRIAKKVKFAEELSSVLERLIITIFYDGNFNEAVGEWLISRLSGFIDEFSLHNKIRSNCPEDYDEKINQLYFDTFNFFISPEHNPEFPLMDKDGKYKMIAKEMQLFNSADVSIASALADKLAYCDLYKNNQNLSFPFNDNTDYIDFYNMITDTGTDFGTTDVANLKYTPVSNDVIDKVDIQYGKKTYREYINTMIAEVIDDIVAIDIKKDDVISRLYRYNICVHPKYVAAYSAETMIFEWYILPGIGEVIDGSKDKQQFICEVQKRVENDLTEIQSEIDSISENDKYGIREQLNKTLFKPFIRLHELDMNELKKRIK